LINLNFSITNPWSDRFTNLFARGGMVTKHKAWEFEIYRSDTVIELEFRISARQNHAGVELGLGLFSWTMRVQLYDTRHWNYIKKEWHDNT